MDEWKSDRKVEGGGVDWGCECPRVHLGRGQSFLWVTSFSYHRSTVLKPQGCLYPKNYFPMFLKQLLSFPLIKLMYLCSKCYFDYVIPHNIHTCDLQQKMYTQKIGSCARRRFYCVINQPSRLCEPGTNQDCVYQRFDLVGGNETRTGVRKISQLFECHFLSMNELVRDRYSSTLNFSWAVDLGCRGVGGEP